MPPVGFELTISAGLLPQTDALERAANGTGTSSCNIKQMYVLPTKYIYVFCMDLSININWLVFRTDTECLLRGTDCL